MNKALGSIPRKGYEQKEDHEDRGKKSSLLQAKEASKETDFVNPPS